MTRFRHSGNPDRNQQAIVDALRRIGAQVMVVSGQGRGEPDLVVGYRGTAWLIEVKNPDGRDTVSPQQAAFLASWPGPTGVVRSAEEAIQLIARAA